MTTLGTHFAFRVDTWTPDGESIVEHVAGVEDYQSACARRPKHCVRCVVRPSSCGGDELDDVNHPLRVDTSVP